MLKKQQLIKKSCRDAFGEALVSLANDNLNIVALTANLEESTRLSDFHKNFPERFFEMGVAEQNMLGVAAGLALSGKIPFATSFGVFSPGRNWDQLRVSVCYSKANVKVIATHCGLSVGEDGATHQALEDIALTRCLPGLVVLAPADYYETQKVVEAAAKHQGPVYIRMPREASPVIFDSQMNFAIGQAQILKKGDDATIIACGPMLAIALEVAELLVPFGLHCEVINASSIKPLDKKTIIASAQKTKFVATIEDHQVSGGLGGAVAELLSQHCPTKMSIFGMLDSFGESGTPEQLYDKYGLSADHITAQIKKTIL